MALRTIRVQGDSVLTKKSRTVDKMTPRIGELITDMLDTMYDAMGVGLAAPQVGMLTFASTSSPCNLIFLSAISLFSSSLIMMLGSKDILPLT